MSVIIPARVVFDATTLDARVLASVLGSTEADLWAPHLLPKEDEEDMAARRAAAADILDDLLVEFAGQEVAA
jgi:hypothetical protein